MKRPSKTSKPAASGIKQEEWLLRYIEDAFEHVSLSGGIDIHRAQSMDDYGNMVEDQLAKYTEVIDWRRVPVTILNERPFAVTFLDAHGFRFYAPAIMTMIVNKADVNSNLEDSFICNLQVDVHGQIKGVPFHSLFSVKQRAAIVRFLKFQIHHRWPNTYGDSELTLTRILTHT
ncbi:DUF6714 family protein [Planctomicrobium piriforme]|uniref:Uncharacterized protein n=1 Tax=Planctomicrobium piriforme TaxID=1576369 RepID=A0A1I3Q2Z2_9PLAN|nr:DUF6714 family protein [Planctomicrobium piriforme]SFJ27827.1 hypothetical protein SAMN05421753_117117 [Planctomicrobium piriforme]